jgi:post-segregation antitoxin (ccd killing protein)
MPRGNPRRSVALRLLPELIDDARALGVPINRTAEDALRRAIERQKRRKAAKVHSPALPDAQSSSPGGAA